MSWKVLAVARHFNISEEARNLLIENDCEIVETEYGGDLNDRAIEEEKLIELLQDVDAFITAQSLVSQRVIEASKSLKVIAKRGVGYERIDVNAATENGVFVTISPDAVNNGVADHVYALMLNVAKRVLESHSNVIHNDWKPSLGVELYGKTIGIVGFGRIGQAVAERAKGFNMEVLAFDLFENQEVAEKYGAKYVTLETLMKQSDFISVNAPLNDSTYHLISEKYFNLMKPTAIIVNTARGGLIDEIALISALKDKKIGGAGLDVFESEPLVHSPLKYFDNVILNTHTAGYTVESMNRANVMAVQNIINIKNGKPLNNGALLNPIIYKTS